MIIKKKNRKLKISKIDLVKKAEITLKNNQFITFKFNKSQEYDFTKKNWGFYISPSINVRLKSNKFKIAIIKNKHEKFFLCGVSNNQKNNFKKYLVLTEQKIICWLSKRKLNQL